MTAPQNSGCGAGLAAAEAAAGGAAGGVSPPAHAPTDPVRTVRAKIVTGRRNHARVPHVRSTGTPSELRATPGGIPDPAVLTGAGPRLAVTYAGTPYAPATGIRASRPPSAPAAQGHGTCHGVLCIPLTLVAFDGFQQRRNTSLIVEGFVLSCVTFSRAA